LSTKEVVVLDKLLIETFTGAKGTAQVFEVVETSASGAEKVIYEIVFGEERQLSESMGDASVRASELAGDMRFRKPDSSGLRA
jgi:hypothetical protein